MLQANTSDISEGTNAHVTYGFSNTLETTGQKFSLKAETGKIMVKEPLDFQGTADYTLAMEVKESGGLVTHYKVEIEVVDKNDNAPEVTLTYMSIPVPEDSLARNMITLIRVNDPDGKKTERWPAIFWTTFPLSWHSPPRTASWYCCCLTSPSCSF
ncbi:hypothetical protein Y1Q_0008449 [Alligator mississippiensis]|uniref:Cadherin domain-containing protein n=1 Tax=Alligator mississippiensis TaxID=8496 RepID=A0A151NR04_ALLMI|nr:hypothetical protein Y1Q_0008449 [Alligator mississippiensis]